MRELKNLIFNNLKFISPAKWWKISDESKGFPGRTYKNETWPITSFKEDKIVALIIAIVFVVASIYFLVR